jgi:hypothetical protein
MCGCSKKKKNNGSLVGPGRIAPVTVSTPPTAPQPLTQVVSSSSQSDRSRINKLRQAAILRSLGR